MELGPSGLSFLTGLTLAGLEAAPSPLTVLWGSLGPRPRLRSPLVAPHVTAAPAHGGHAGGSPSPPGPPSLSPTDIGPVTLTADPALFQRELRELYVQVGSRPCCWPSGPVFPVQARRGLCAFRGPRWWLPTSATPASQLGLWPAPSLGGLEMLYFLGFLP